MSINIDKLVAKYLIKGTIITTSPLLIGKGKGGDAADIVLTRRDGEPYIPGSSFAGALRSFAKKMLPLNVTEEAKVGKPTNWEYFWGTGSDNSHKDNTSQSHLIVHDLVSSSSIKSLITIRDGVCIDSKTGIADDQAKYDYELLEPGAVFEFSAEATVRGEFEHDWFKQMLNTIPALLGEDDFRIGALTNTGFGRIKANLAIYPFSFKENGAANWFNYLQNKTLPPSSAGGEAFKLNESKTFRIQATFSIKSALIIGSYNTDPIKPDKSQLLSKGNPILSGKSIRGAVRHRAKRIFELFSHDTQAFNTLFGYTDNKKPGDTRETTFKSKLRIEETTLAKRNVSKPHTRIRVDRFTGGVIDGALFDSEPLWKQDNDTFQLTFVLRDYENWQAGLLLHLLKDLWTEDLPIGGEKNVGRGILKGEKAIIKWADKEVILERKGDAPLASPEDLADLEEFSAALHTLSNPQNQ